MDGNAAAGELIPPTSAPPNSGRVQFRIASRTDDENLRRLLRENPMAGRISLSLEREPSYFDAAKIEGADHRTIIAVENGHIACAGSISTRMRYINGEAMRIGYLGGLRLDASCRGRTGIIVRGYQMFREMHEHGGPPIYLTSIVGDNLPARRLLEKGVRGMPTYRFVGEFVTLAISTRKFSRADEAGIIPAFSASGAAKTPAVEPNAVIEFLSREQAKYQFAPAWSADDFLSDGACPGLSSHDLHILKTPGGEIAACAAIWDQRSLKQAVVRGYSPTLRRLRPVYNAFAAILKRPRFPEIGRAIPIAFVSHLATQSAEPGQVLPLIRSLCRIATQRGIDYLTAGFDARDPRLKILRRATRPREYSSRLYAVHWDDGAELAVSLDDRLLAPELALL